jgi:hypothetical protein
MASKLLSGYQTMAFWIASVTAILVIVILDFIDWADPCLAIYATDTVIAFICASMFSDWWRVKGSATSIFKWLTVLLFALFFNDGVQFYARWLFEYRPAQYTPFLDSWIWNYRSAPKMIALIYLFSFAMWQRFGSSSTYHDGIRQDMANGFNRIEARIVEGELIFDGHSHEGLKLNANIILKQKGVTE